MQMVGRKAGRGTTMDWRFPGMDARQSGGIAGGAGACGGGWAAWVAPVGGSGGRERVWCRSVPFHSSAMRLRKDGAPGRKNRDLTPFRGALQQSTLLEC